jgi:hypothetical protein
MFVTKLTHNVLYHVELEILVPPKLCDATTQKTTMLIISVVNIPKTQILKVCSFDSI